MLPAVIERVYATGCVAVPGGGTTEVFPDSLPRRHAEALVDLIAATGARTTLEVGVRFGVSTVVIATALLEGGSHIGVDLSIEPAARALVDEAGVGDRVQLVAQPSELALPALLADGAGGTLDLVVVDGDHRFDHAFVDGFYGFHLLREGGTLVLHDLWIPSVRRAAAALCAAFPLVVLDSPINVLFLRSAGPDRRSYQHDRVPDEDALPAGRAPDGTRFDSTPPVVLARLHSMLDRRP